MDFDYVRAAGEVLAKTGDGGKAFEAYCHMRMVRPQFHQMGEAVHLFRDGLCGVWPLTPENCAKAFRDTLVAHHMATDEWIEVK